MSDAEAGFFTGKARQLDDGRWRCANCPRKYKDSEPAKDCCVGAPVVDADIWISHGTDPEDTHLKIGEQGSTKAWIEAKQPVDMEHHR